MSRSLSELRHRHVIEGRPLDSATERALRSDPRAGARAILQAVERRRFEARSEGQRLRKMLRYELALWSAGIMTVAGVDEAGMSPLAGPVAAGAVVFRPGIRITGVDDSKKLDAQTRERLADQIRREAFAWSVGFVEVEEIDRINIYHASLLAMRRAVEGLSCAPQHLLIDGRRIKQLQTSAAGHHRGRREMLRHRCRVNPSQDRPRCFDAEVGWRASRIRFCKAQGLPGARPPGRP